MAKVKESKEKMNLEETLKDLDKKYGKGSVMSGGELEGCSAVVSTGSIGLDSALGIGGLPMGKIIEIYGWESSGKSTLTQTIIGNAQKLFKETGRKCLLIDGENSLDEKYAKNLGVDMNELLLIQLDESAGEGAYTKMEALVETGEIGLVVIDSYNSLQPKSVLIDGEFGQAVIGKHAKLVGDVVQKANLLCSKYDCMFIFIGQIREKIGVMFGSPETTQGGNALKFYSHIRLDVRKSMLKEGDVYYANKTKVTVKKNKMAPPFKVAEFEIVFGKGIDSTKELLDLGSDQEVFRKYGNNITYNENKVTIEEFITQLDNEDFRKEIVEKISEKLSK